MKRKALSERAASSLANISRITWHAVVSGKSSVAVRNLQAAAEALDLEMSILLTPRGAIHSDYATVAVGLNVLRDGETSWKIHFMNFIDEFRRTLDPRLLLLPPPSDLSLKLKALLAAMVSSLCQEAQMETPHWARRRYDLPQPWFVAGLESLKAMALLESPLPFRRNNIFVLANFMERV